VREVAQVIVDYKGRKWRTPQTRAHVAKKWKIIFVNALLCEVQMRYASDTVQSRRIRVDKRKNKDREAVDREVYTESYALSAIFFVGGEESALSSPSTLRFKPPAEGDPDTFGGVARELDGVAERLLPASVLSRDTSMLAEDIASA
jgi:hypothetical protein